MQSRSNIFSQSGDTIPTNYTNVTTDLTLWRDFGENVSNDFLQYREHMRESLDYKGGWTACTNDERDYLIDMFTRPSDVVHSADSTNKVIHLMTTKGMSQAQAAETHQHARGAGDWCAGSSAVAVDCLAQAELLATADGCTTAYDVLYANQSPTLFLDVPTSQFPACWSKDG